MFVIIMVDELDIFNEGRFQGGAGATRAVLRKSLGYQGRFSGATGAIRGGSSQGVKGGWEGEKGS